MPEPRMLLSEDEAAARACGLGLLEASRAYEGWVIPRREGFLFPREVQAERRVIVGLVARQRRLLSAAYLVADADRRLEAEVLLCSMFEFLVCQKWIALSPGRNVALWLKGEQKTSTTRLAKPWSDEPGLRVAARGGLSPAPEHGPGRAAEAPARSPGKVARESDEVRPSEPSLIERRAIEVGLGFYYDTIYQPTSQTTHPTVYAIARLLEPHPKGLRVRATPLPEHEPRHIYLKGALLLRDSLRHAGEQSRALRGRDVDLIASHLDELARHHLTQRLPIIAQDRPQGSTLIS